jgi:2-dehydro-3-deoxygluconokinase
MGFDIVCMGEPMLEFNQQPRAADGRLLYLEGHGGDTSNAAIAASRQGARVAMLTGLGQDPAGDSFMQLWADEGVEGAHVRRDPDHQTAVYFVMHGPQGHEFLFYRRDSAASHFGPRDVPEELIANCRYFYASGISQGISPIAADAVFRAIEIAKVSGAQVAFDTNYRPRLWPPVRAAATIHAAVALADIVLPTIDDARMLTGLTRPDDILDFYLRLGPRIVALKMGAEGAMLATPERRIPLPPFPCRPVDGTGAGDTFCGSFLARLCAGDSPEEAGRYAACAAALSTEGYGAVAPIPRAEQVRRALAAAA